MSTTTEAKARRVRILPDENPGSPREWDNLGRMVCWHRRYRLGDEQPEMDPQEWLEAYQAENPGAIILPLYLYDHSGITISTGPFSCPWDSGQVGWIVVSKAKIEEEYGKGPEAEAKARSYLENEVTTYDQFLRGDVYGFVCEEGTKCDHGDTHWDDVNSCWGFYGRDVEANGMLEYMEDEAWKALLRQAEVEYE